MLLDAAGSAADLVLSPLRTDQMITAALLAIVDRAWPDEALRALDGEALALSAEGLERLDERLPAAFAREEWLLPFAHDAPLERAGDLVGARRPARKGSDSLSSPARRIPCSRMQSVKRALGPLDPGGPRT